MATSFARASQGEVVDIGSALAPCSFQGCMIDQSWHLHGWPPCLVSMGPSRQEDLANEARSQGFQNGAGESQEIVIVNRWSQLHYQNISKQLKTVLLLPWLWVQTLQRPFPPSRVVSGPTGFPTKFDQTRICGGWNETSPCCERNAGWAVVFFGGSISRSHDNNYPLH